MGAIVIPGNTVERVFGDAWPKVHAGLSKVVADSFGEKARGMRNPTKAEVNRRIDFCLVKAAELCMEMHWSGERVVDEMPAALKAFIDGTKWEPSKRTSWGNTDQTWTQDN